MFHNIQQNIENMQYGCNVQSLVVLMPGLSLVVEKMQIQNILHSAEQNYEIQPNKNIIADTHVKIDHIYKWHAIGGMIQMVALAILTRSSSLFVIPCALAVYHFYYSFTGFLGDRTCIQISPTSLKMER